MDVRYCMYVLFCLLAIQISVYTVVHLTVDPLMNLNIGPKCHLKISLFIFIFKKARLKGKNKSLTTHGTNLLRSKSHWGKLLVTV